MRTFAALTRYPRGKRTGSTMIVRPSMWRRHTHQVRHLLGRTAVQPKLTIGAPNDQYEREADRIADMIVDTPRVDVQCQATEEEDELLLAKHESSQAFHIQRLCKGCEEELQRQPIEEEEEEPVLAKGVAGHDQSATPQVRTQVQGLRNGGEPLLRSARSYFEPRLGHDFSQVRIHTDQAATDTAHAIHARAFTFGDHIAFGASEYHPETPAGKRLLAHELAHVVQQSGQVNRL